MTRIEELWISERQRAEREGLRPGEIHLTRIRETSRYDIHAGLDEAGCALLAIGVSRRPPSLQIRSDALDTFRHKKRDGSWLIVLRLSERALEAVFGRLCQDLVDAAELEPDEPSVVRLLGDRLRLWERLFGRSGKGLLEAHEVKGLIAELLVLESLIEECERPGEVVVAWVGPTGADQDFLFPDRAIEVKGVAADADRVSISSLQQLGASVPMELALVRLVPTAAGSADGVGLNALVARIESRLATDLSALRLFEARLLEAGYIEHERYDAILFAPVGRQTFAISDGFPRLTPDTVPAGVITATYAVAISSLDPFKTESV